MTGNLLAMHRVFQFETWFVRAVFAGVLLAWAPLLSAIAADTVVLTSVLADFANRTDTMSGPAEGVLLIQSETSVWTPEKIGYYSLRSRTKNCRVSSELFDSLASKNSASISTTTLITPTKRWRVLSKGEEESILSSRYLDRTVRGERVKTVVELSNPAYSPSGSNALVLLSFRWSIHGALAKYQLQKTGSVWKVQCSELVFYP